MKFSYRSGERPLEGYTLKRGVGQGGFGEVYFAVSDGGKEVALKLLRGHSDIELRGVMNCLNMKHPNLVHVYDLKEDEHKNKWLIMEYVLGESLDRVLHRHPTGLTIGLTKEWFGALSRAVGYLHDRGVVHRDLKPANIFLEAGTLKVGDYGLCKTLSPSQRQTRTVGTVHYMAPEVSTGNYSQKIDIYACGIILHEMLTGKVPFDGETDGEILMKHLTATPDLSHVPEVFKPILTKALDKNPVRRYGTIAEMARAVEGAQLPLAAPFEAGTAQANTQTYATVLDAKPTIPVAIAQPKDLNPEILPEIQKAKPVVAPLPPPPADKTKLPVAKVVTPPTVRDRFTGLLQALLLAPFIALAGVVPYALVSQSTDWPWLAKITLTTTALAWAVLLGSGAASVKSVDSWARRLRIGGLGLLVGLLAYWLDGNAMPRWGSVAGSNESNMFGMVIFPQNSITGLSHYLLYFGGVLAAGRWWIAAARDRKERIRFVVILAAAFWSALLLFLWPWSSGSAANGIVPFVLCAIAVQMVSPWSPVVVPTQTGKKLRLKNA